MVSQSLPDSDDARTNHMPKSLLGGSLGVLGKSETVLGVFWGCQGPVEGPDVAHEAFGLDFEVDANSIKHRLKLESSSSLGIRSGVDGFFERFKH